MRARSKKWITALCILAVGIAVGLNLLFSRDLLPSGDNLWTPPAEKTAEPPASKPSSAAASMVFPENSAGPVIEKEKSVDIENVQYTVDSVDISKKPENFPIPQYMVGGDMQYPTADGRIEYITADENGVIQNGFSYLDICFTIENNSSELKELSFLNYFLYVYDKESGKIVQEAEVCTMDINEENKYSRDYYIYQLQPGEKITVHLGYIVDDDCLHSTKVNNLVLNVNTIGIMAQSDLIKNILLNDMIETGL